MVLGSTRRDLLTGMLGLAFAGCRRPERRLFVDGGFVEDGRAEGHRLRDGWVGPDDAKTTEVKVVIVGGGIAGLTAGWSLLGRGLSELQLFELGRTVGGTATFGQGPAGPFPFGAHYLPAPLAHDQPLIGLLREVGAALPDDGGPVRYAEEHLVADPKERVWYRGAWFPGIYPGPAITTADRQDLARFEATIAGLVGARGEDGLRPFTLPLHQGSRDPRFLALDQLDFAEWLQREGHHSALVQAQAAYACRDDFGTEPAATSAWYGLHYFAARIARPEEESAELLSWPAGNGFLAAHLARRLGERVQTERVVVAVKPADDGRRAKVITVDRRTGTFHHLLAEQVIVAVPAHVRSRIVQGFGPPPERPTVAPWLVANLHLSDRPGYEGAEIAWDNVIHGSKSLGYVVNNHRDGPARGPTTWTYYLPLTGDPTTERRKLESLTFEDAAQVVLADLSRCHSGLQDNLQKLEVWRWGHGMIRPVPGTLARIHGGRDARPIGPLHFAHTELSGVALFEEAFFHGQRAAAEVWAARGGQG